MMHIPIYIQSHSKEIINGRLTQYIQKYQQYLKEYDVTVFLDNKSKPHVTSEFKKIMNDTGVSLMYSQTNKINNETTEVFFSMMLHDTVNSPEVLLLETDTHVDFKNINKMFTDYKKRSGVWIYGSHYNGNSPWVRLKNKDAVRYRRQHMNGVGIYNRCKDFVEMLKDEREDAEMCTRFNYDWYLYSNVYIKKMSRDQRRTRFIDSKYIINISTVRDIKVDYKQIKPEAVIVHTKAKSIY